MHDKQFKDPIYGYINISRDIVTKIIDTPTFQRLKDIRQTSYTPLFPAAYHNRYVHSLGVYHLGRIAFHAIEPQLMEKWEDNSVKNVKAVFELACLLHDVGHAPFSHTGENFFLDKANTLYNLLKQSVDSPLFSSDFDNLGAKRPAAHECMSSVVGLKAFPDFFATKEDRSLFARCIIGMPISLSVSAPDINPSATEEERRAATKAYDEYQEKKTQIELANCVIGLLNSSIIDVDRLDYIIRDAETIGFKNAQVDYIRLLSGLRIVEYNKKLCIGYHKSALSVIESAVYAHDAEKKWIQGHPSILYEMETIRSAMQTLTNKFSSDSDPNPIFCYEALTETGKTLQYPISIFSEDAKALATKGKLWTTEAQELIKNNGLFVGVEGYNPETLQFMETYPISLLADEDILHLMKQFCREGLGYEYFARNRRRLAAWKSEAEFRALFQEHLGDDSRAIKKLEIEFNDLVSYCQTKTDCPIVDERIFSFLDAEVSNAEKEKENKTIPKDIYDDLVGGVNAKRYWANVLKELANDLNLNFEFLIVFQKRFNSSFKTALGQIPILFPNVKEENGVVPLEKVVNILKSSADHKSNFFHLFYVPKDPINDVKKREIVQAIAERLIEKTNHR